MLRELTRRREAALLTTHGPSEDPRALEAALPRRAVVAVLWALAKRGSARALGQTARPGGDGRR